MRAATPHTQRSNATPAYARVIRSRDAGPVHGLQRRALASALPCAKVLERVPPALVVEIRELVHAIAGLGLAACSYDAKKRTQASWLTDTQATTSDRRGCTARACTHRAVAFLFRPERDDALARIIDLTYVTPTDCEEIVLVASSITLSPGTEILVLLESLFL